jgi:hypothetical protein
MSDHFPDADFQAQEAPPAPPPGPTGGLRLLTVITAPRATFEAMAARPQPWVGVVALLVLVALCSAVILHVSQPEQMEAQLDSRFGEQLRENEDFMERMARADEPTLQERVTAGAIAGVSVTAMIFLMSLIYWLGCVVVGGKAGFRPTLDVVFLCAWVGAGIGLLATVPLILAKGSVMTTGWSLAQVVSAVNSDVDTDGMLYRSLAIFTNLFSLWQLWLMATGFAVVHRLSAGRGWIAAGVPWLIMNSFNLALVALFT